MTQHEADQTVPVRALREAAVDVHPGADDPFANGVMQVEPEGVDTPA